MPSPRTVDMKAQRIARSHATTQQDLDKLLEQFNPKFRPGILRRLQPHLNFEPKALPPRQ